MKKFITVAGLLATAASSSALGAAEGGADASSPVLSFKTVNLSPPRTVNDVNNSYTRLVLAVPASVAGKVQSDTRSQWEIVKRKLLAALWDKRSTLTVAVKPYPSDGQDLPIQQILVVKTDSGETTTEIAPVVITPYTKDAPSQIKLELIVSTGQSVDSGIFAAANSALKAASALSTGGLLSKVTSKDYSETAAKLDKDVSALFATTNPQNFFVLVDPYTTDTVDLSTGSGSLVAFKYEAITSLIGGGDHTKIKTDPVDITSFVLSVPDKTGPKQMTIHQLLDQKDATTKKSVADIITTESAENFREFCSEAPAVLADHGLNSYDRAAVMYAYLRSTGWNKYPSMRPPADQGDPCADATEKLADMPQLKLKSLSEVEREDQEYRKALLDKFRKTLWVTIPTVLKSPNADNWTKILAPMVHFSVTGSPAKLNADSDPVSAGGSGYDIAGDELAQSLATAALTYSKSFLPCFTVNSGARATNFASQCMKLDTMAGPLTVEFSVADDYDPRATNDDPLITAIRIITPAPAAATATSAAAAPAAAAPAADAPATTAPAAAASPPATPAAPAPAPAAGSPTKPRQTAHQSPTTKGTN